MSGYCDVAPGHPFHGPYHDHEYGFPLEDDAALFERLVLEINQAGLSWLTILKKKDAFRRAFDGFDIATVAVVMAAYSITTAAFELPTGGLADVVGRRPVLIAASALFVVQILVLGLGQSVTALALDPRFDVRKAYWLVAGIAGVAPAGSEGESMEKGNITLRQDLTCRAHPLSRHHDACRKRRDRRQRRRSVRDAR